MQATIQPYQVGPRSATRLFSPDSGGQLVLGRGMCFTYQLQEVVVNPTTPPTETVATLISDATYMTQTQWASWSAGGTSESDAAYILSCIAKNVPGVTITA